MSQVQGQGQLVRGAAVYLDFGSGAGEQFLEGVEGLTVFSLQGNLLDDTDINKIVMSFKSDIPNPGQTQFSLFANPGDPVHRALAQRVKDGKPVAFRVITRGNKVNGINTKHAEAFGSIKVSAVAAFAADNDDKKVLTYIANSAKPALPFIGDYLLEAEATPPALGAAAAKDYIIVERTDLDTADSTKFHVVRANKGEKSSPIGQISAEDTLYIYRPAVQEEYTGIVNGFSLEGASGFFKTPVQIQITTNITQKIGTPNLT